METSKILKQENLLIGLKARSGTIKNMAKSNRSPNDQRSDRYNPNSAEYKAAVDNRSVQIGNNPTNSKSKAK